MTYDVMLIANALIKLAYEDEARDPMTNLKLQKLLYYEQAYHLALFGTPLFNEEIEAWKYGPVVPVVYDYYSKFGREGLSPDYDLGIEEISDEELDLFFKVFNTFSQFSAYGLMEMTHSEKPWVEADRPLGRGRIIPNETIMRYFIEKINSDVKK